MSGCPGCVVWGTRLDRVAVEAHSVAEGFPYEICTDDVDPETGRVLGQTVRYNEPKPKDLTPLKSLILVTMYKHHDFFGIRFGRPAFEILGVRRLRGRGGWASYPLRLDIRLSLWPYPVGEANTAEPYVLAFADGCWPVLGDEVGWYGHSTFSTEQYDLHPPPPGADGRIRCVFYRRSQPFFDGEAAKAMEVDRELPELLDKALPALVRAVDGSAHLTSQDRRLVYAQLLDVAAIQKAYGGQAQAAIFEEAHNLLREKLAKLGSGKRP